MDLGISCRHAIICASSCSLGLACADALGSEGVQLTIDSRNGEELTGVAEELSTRHGVTASTVVGDFAIADTTSQLLVTCPSSDIQMNNRGPTPGRFTDWD